MDRERTLYEELEDFQYPLGKLIFVLASGFVQFALIPVRFILWLNEG